MAQTVKVKKGDTLSGIAKAAGTTVQAIQKANPQITNPNLIKPGQTFLIPGTQSATGSAATGAATGSTATGNAATGGTTTGAANTPPGFVRNAAAEAAAIAAGTATREEIERRGGVSAAGYYGDTFNPVTSLTDAEYAAAIAGKTGAEQGLAINAAIQKKIDASNPKKPEVGGAGGAGSEIDKDVRDAFALLKSTFTLYGLEELAPVIGGYMKQGLTSNEAIIELRQNKTYQTRFAGNTKRTAAGLNALTEGEYLALEDSYSETLRAYGQQTLLGTDKTTRQSKMADIIGGDISPIEFKDRVSTVVNRVENADPLVKKTLRDFYKITDTELVSYFLNPTENLPRLQEKVTAAEIGSAALAQGGLTTDMTTAESLAKFGVDLATARRGYSTISDVLPTTTKLSQIYKEDNINYNQKVAEEEVFKGLASAQRKRTQLAEKEIASFQGSSGVGAAGLSTTYLRRGSAAGQF
jgi:murein DD-endopeptidase MepM/ murein hydrolase activator NlpD